MLVFALFWVHFYWVFREMLRSRWVNSYLALGRNLRRKYDEETDGSLFKIRKEKEKFTEKCSENS